MRREKELRKSDMSEQQFQCFELLCELFHGAHHVPRIHSWGTGIRCSISSGKLSTFDFDYLTRLVVLAHDHCVRAEITSSGPRLVGIVLHKRHGRTGGMCDRHPTIEDAISSMKRTAARHAQPDARVAERGEK